LQLFPALCADFKVLSRGVLQKKTKSASVALKTRRSTATGRVMSPTDFVESEIIPIEIS
jgi:hypothetical protein